MFYRISNIMAGILVFSVAVYAKISLCNFNFGIDFEQHSIQACGKVGCTISMTELKIDPSEVEIDFISMPIGFTDKGTDEQMPPAPYSGREGVHLEICRKLLTTPVWYSNIISEGIKCKLGTNECDSSRQGLCLGAQYVRDNDFKIINQYKEYATFVANTKNWGIIEPIVFVIEPKFYQYTSSMQKNPLTYFEACQLLSKIAAAIKSILPNAWIAADIPVMADTLWWRDGLPYQQIKFLSSSNGKSLPSKSIHTGDSLSWAGLWAKTKRGMIADNGYGKEGFVDSSWFNVDTLNARIADGVIGLLVPIGDTAWTSRVEAIRPQLDSLKTCSLPSVKQFTLNLQAGEGGSIEMSMVPQTKYDSATYIQLKAVPKLSNEVDVPDNQFVSWGGDITGTSQYTTYVINKNSTITATFKSQTTKVSTQTSDTRLPFSVHCNQRSLSIRLLAAEGSLRTDIFAADGAKVTGLQNTSVQKGIFTATYSLAGFRAGLYVVRVVNGSSEYKETTVILP